MNEFKYDSIDAWNAHMRWSLIPLMLVLLDSVPANAAAKPVGHAQRDTPVLPHRAAEIHGSAVRLTVQDDPQQRAARRRYAYVGRWGNFHLVGGEATAAYAFGGQKYIATLRSTGEDGSYWYYDPVLGGDGFIVRWAFATRPDSCGKYWVWAFGNGMWKPYELADAWGIAFRELSAPVMTSTEPSVESRLKALRFRQEELRQRVDKIELRLEKPGMN